jgi:hypothetical protein
MDAHHQAAIAESVKRFESMPGLVAILLAGSLAHGLAAPGSDVDIILVVDDEEYARRSRERRLAFSIRDICQYEGGYVDCKITSIDVLVRTAAAGSDAARYAFKDARILGSTRADLDGLLQRVCRFPVEEKAVRQHRFACQLLAWKWYMSQADEKQNAYLRHLAAQKITLFACRLVLNANERLYPYHKWLLAETARAERQPPAFGQRVVALLDAPGFEDAQRLVDDVFAFLGLSEKDIDWPNQFLADSEMTWLDGQPPVDDL